MKTSIAAIFGLSVVLANAAAADPATCEDIVAVGHTFISGPASFDGSATTNLGEAIVHVDLLGVKPLANGKLNAATSHTFTLGSAVFSTRDNAMLTPLNDRGLFRLNTQANVDGEAFWGQLSVDGLVDLSPSGWAKWLATGQLCSR
jgi:hypothetical protein